MKKLILLSLISVFVAFSTYATNITGTVTSSTTWTAANSPYIIQNSIEVNPTVILTIESGVTVKFNAGTYLHVRGTLNATGVIFTANVGSTKGFWDGIYVSYESYEVGNVNLNNCTVEYASNLYTRKGTLTLSYCTINNLSGSVRVSSISTLNIDNTTISNSNFPVTLYGDGAKINPGNNIVFNNNVYNYIDLDFSEITQSLNLKDFGYPYFNDNSLVVRASGELKIDPGVNLQIHNTEISVYGKIKAIGTKLKPIVFGKYLTSSYWLGLNIYNSSIDADCVLRNCEFKNASYNHEWYCALEIENASPTVDSCKFSDNVWNMNIAGISKPIISNCNFGPSIQASGEAYNISVDMNVDATFLDNSISFNSTQLRAIRIRPSDIINKGHLRKVSFQGINNITYCMYETTTVLDTASLIIDPGVVIKCRQYNAYLNGNGKITGIGTDAEPIIFTHLGDDNYGNPLDTQNNEVNAITYSNSGRIMLNSIAESKLENWKIIYGGYNSDYWAVYVNSSNILNKCEIKNSFNAVRFSQNAQITNNKFTNITNYPIGYLASQGTLDLSGNTQLNCGYKGIVLEGINNDSPTLKKLNFAEYTNLPYILTTALTVAAGNTLTINPGVVIKSHNFGNRALLVNGGLQAIGTKNEKITFTSIKDDALSGDTNNDATGSVPGYADWNGIEFSGTSNAGNVMRNCEVKYAGNMWYNPAPVQMTDCHVLLDSVKINFANQCGLGIFGSANPEIKDCDINNVSWEPIYMDIFSKPTFTGSNKLSNVGNIAVKLRGGTVSGTLPSINFTGYNPITYILAGETVTVNDELIIPEGITIKGSGRWNIKGKLTINGTASKPVVFTTPEDDRYGNPKDGQQNGAAALNNNGGYIVFYENSNDESLINHTIFAYSMSTPINLNNASPTIQNCTFDNINKEAIVLNGISTPAINNCTFNNVSYPLYTSMLTYPSSTIGNVIQGNTGKGIRLFDETLTQNVTLQKRNFGGIDNIPWIMGNYTVGSSAKLTIEPGVIVKFLDYGYLNISNGLIARGGNTPDSTIVFTSARDDLYGGDTYNNGTSDAPWNNSWQGIYFLNESMDEDCILKNCIFRYGSYSSGRAAVTMDNASPTIQNCKFDKGYHGVMAFNYSNPIISNCDFSNTEYNSGYAIWNKSTIINLVAANCWFNSATGPRHTSNLSGTGERISDNVTFIPFNAQLQNAELGDVSMNGTIQSYDASLILQHAVSNIVLNPAQQKVADVSKNGSISSYDASLILQYNVGLIFSFTNTGASLIRKKTPASVTSINFANLANSSITNEFIVPINITSGTGISSLDMKLEFNSNHISLIDVKTENNSTALLSFTEKTENGHLAVSLASAYDLAFENKPVYLKFKLNNPNIEQSELTINSAIANDKEVNILGSPCIVSSKIISGLSNLNPENNIKVWNENNLLYLSLNSPQPINILSIKVLEMSGKTISNYEFKNIESGNQLLKLPLSKNSKIENGVYLMQIKLDNNSSITKKIVIK